MAQPFRCDQHNAGHPADVLLTNLETGDVTALCNQAFVEMALAIVEAASAAAEAVDSGQLPGPADPEAETDAEVAETDAEAADRLAHLGRPSPADPVPSTVVKRGTSRSRKAYQARQASRAARVAPGATGEPDGRPGPSGEGTEDVDGAGDG